MKHLFTPVNVMLTAMSGWMVWCCGSMLEWDASGNLIAHSYSVWGDWSAHFTFISNLLERGPGWIFGDSPVFHQFSFQYPFLSHILTAMFAWITRLSVPMAVYVTSLALLAIAPFVVYRLYLALGLKSWTSLAAVVLFFFAGGVQFMDSELKATDPLTNQFDAASVFTQFVLFELFPQRAFLFGLLAFSWMMMVYLKNRDRLTLGKQVVLLFGLSLLTWLHLHSWIAMATLLLGLFFFPETQKRSRIFLFGASVAAISGLLIAALLLRESSPEYKLPWTLWYPGWAQNQNAGIQRAQDMSFITFWGYNTGLFLPLAIFGSFVSIRYSLAFDAWRRAFAFAGFILFLIGITLNLQPYYYDNLKVFTYSFFFLAPVAAICLEYMALNWLWLAVPALILALQSTSAISDFNYFRTGHQNALFFSAPEFELAQEFKQIRGSANDLTLIVPKHNHWVPALTGTPIVMGFPGWLWSWGINYGKREREVQSLLLGEGDVSHLVSKWGLKYIVVNEREMVDQKPVNFAFLNQSFDLKLQKHGWFIYSVK